MATFENDLDLRGKVKLINTVLQSEANLPSPLANKIGGIYYNTTDKNIRVNTEGTSTWFNTLLWSSTTYAGTALPIFSNAKKGYIENLPNSSSNKFVYLDTLGQPTLKQYVDFNWLDPAIRTDDAAEITNGGTKLPNANAVYDFVTSAISTATGSYLPLAGGTMAGNITMSSGNRVIFNVADNYIVGSSTALSLVGKTSLTFKVGTTDYLSLTATGLIPFNNSTYMLGSSSKYFNTAYITTVVTNIVEGTTLGLNDSTSLTLTASSKSIFFNDGEFSPTTTGVISLGTSSKLWTNVYSSVLTTSSIVLSGATGLTSVATTITSISHPTTAIPTADAVWNLFDTIDPFNTTAGSYGTVATNTALANKDLYYLRGDNTWQSLIWDLTGTTVTLKSGIAATVFNVAATTTVAFKVRGNNYTIQSTYDGADVTLYLGEIGPSLATQRYYPIEVVSNLRTRSSILFGGTLATAAEIKLEKGSDILGTPVLTVGSSLLQCGGITTNGTNVWQLGNFGVGIINQVGVIDITIDGVTRYVNYGTIT